jgi:hypothetical protein
MSHELKKVEVRLKLTEGTGLYSSEPIDQPETAVRIMAEVMAELDREEVCVVNMDGRGHPINFNVVSIGSLNSSLISMGNVFKTAILSNAASVMLIHNHPSSDTAMSRQDESVTKQLMYAGQIMGIPVLDHIIVGGMTGECYSLRSHYPELFETELYSQKLQHFHAAEPVESFSVKKFKEETEKWFHPIDGRSVRKVEETVSGYVNWKLENEGIDAKLIGLAVIGSRCRGLEYDGSDLDIVAEYRGDVREDVLFDILHEDGLQIGGIKVDINPITEEKTGTLASYLANAQEYIDRELAFSIADRYIMIHKTDEGYDYSILNPNYREIDGGVYERYAEGMKKETTIREALEIIVEDLKQNPDNNGAKGHITQESKLVPVNYGELEEKVGNVSAMTAYGYRWDRMLPLSKEKAVELYQKGVMVQKLYPDDTETYVQGMEDLQGHDGMFGVERGDWDNWKKEETQKQRRGHQKVR